MSHQAKISIIKNECASSYFLCPLLTLTPLQAFLGEIALILPQVLFFFFFWQNVTPCIKLSSLYNSLLAHPFTHTHRDGGELEDVALA